MYWLNEYYYKGPVPQTHRNSQNFLQVRSGNWWIFEYAESSSLSVQLSTTWNWSDTETFLKDCLTPPSQVTHYNCWSTRLLCIRCRSIRTNTAHLAPAFLYMCTYAFLSFLLSLSIRVRVPDMLNKDMLNTTLVFYLSSLRENGKGLWIVFAVWE